MVTDAMAQLDEQKQNMPDGTYKIIADGLLASMHNVQSDIYVLNYLHIRPRWCSDREVIALHHYDRTVLVPLTDEERAGLPSKAGESVPDQLWHRITRKDCVYMPYIGIDSSHCVGPDDIEVEERVLFMSVKKYQQQ
jgi:hypothetical protein